MTENFRDLTGIMDALWRRLEEGAQVADSPARNLSLATSGPDGAAVRLVVLRGADRATASLTFYTHAHSGKIAHLERTPKAQLLLWDPASNFQARLSAHITMTPGTKQIWETLTRGARLNYATDPLPGTLMRDPAAHAPTPDPGLLTVLTARIETIDLLHLGALPHARAIFSREDGFRGQWIAP
jgi:hypothetical protein